MNKFSAVAISGLSGLGGLSLYYYLKSDEKVPEGKIDEKPLIKPLIEKAPEIPMQEKLSSINWDDNWDCRNVNKPVKNTKGIRHLILVRHGQYNLKGVTDTERVLTELGRKQAVLTGKRLQQLELPISNVVMSTMTRAQETGNIILDQLKNQKSLTIVNDSLIREGEPIQESEN